MIKWVEQDRKVSKDSSKGLGKEEEKQKQELSHTMSTGKETERMKAPIFI